MLGPDKLSSTTEFGLQTRAQNVDAPACYWGVCFGEIHSKIYVVAMLPVIVVHMNHSRLLIWSQHFYIIGLVLALVFIIPAAWFPFQLGKVALFGVCLLGAVVLFCAGGGVRTLARSKGVSSALLIAALPLTYLLSWYFSTNPSVGISGFSVESDTVLFVTLAALSFLVSWALFRSAWSAKVLLGSVFGAAAAASLFQYVVIIFGTAALPLAAFADRSVNLVGKWNDLGLLVGLALLLLLVWVEFSHMSPRGLLAAGVAGLLLLLPLAIIQFPLVWSLLLASCLLISLWSFTTKHRGREGVEQPLPWLPLAGAAIAGLMLLWGSVLGGGITSVFPVSSLEVRPAFSSTLDVLRAAHGSSAERFFVGSGPNAFGSDWLLHKPQGVNQSQFWNLDFTVGFSTFMTALDSVGVLGALAWLMAPLLVLLGMLRVVRTAAFSARERLLALSLSAGALYLWSSVLLYVPSENNILLAFALAGAAFGFSMRHRAPEDEEPPASSGRLARLGLGVVSLVCIVLVLYVAFSLARRAVAEGYTNQGLAALSQGNADLALSSAAQAQKIEATGNSSLLGVAAGSLKLQQMINSTKEPSKEIQAAFATQLQKTIVVAQTNITAYPKDYRNYLSLGNIYSLLVPLGVQGAYESAKPLYLETATHSPSNPQIPLALARLEVLHKNAKAAETYVAQALTLKPDYTDAILFVVQLDVANNDLPSAIRAAQAAVQSAPGVASIWFELGLLYYTNKDIKNAIVALEQATKIERNYANAKYFLGLSYAAQGRGPEAVQEFVDLQKTNPENAEVAHILSNLQQGRRPFDGVPPPANVAPQNRTSAPISQ